MNYIIKQTKIKITKMNAITITTPDQLVAMIIGVASFFIVGFALSYLHYRLTEKNQAN